MTQLPPHSSAHASRPKVEGRVYGEQVQVGEPLQLKGDADLREQVERSLEVLAKQRLLDAENEAQQLVADIQAKAQAEAEQRVADAQAQARSLVDTAQAEADGIRQAAHEEGFKTGFQEGYADATQQVEQETVSLLEGAQLLVEGAYQAERRVLKEFDQHAVALIRHLVLKILDRELSDSPDVLMSLVHRAVDSLYMSGKVRVVVSAQVIQSLREFSAKVEQSLDEAQRFEFVADPALAPDQVFITGQEGSFELTPSTQLEQLLAPVASAVSLPRPEASQRPVEASESIDLGAADQAQALAEESLASATDDDTLPRPPSEPLEQTPPEGPVA